LKIKTEEENPFFGIVKFTIRPYDLLYITPIEIRHKKHSGLRGGEKNERK